MALKDWKLYTDEKYRKQWKRNDNFYVAVLQIMPDKTIVNFVVTKMDDANEMGGFGMGGFSKRVKSMEEGIRRAKQYMRTH